MNGPIVLVVDSLNSALGISALMRSRLNPHIQVIAALEHRTMFSLIKTIHEIQPTLIIFTWRFLLYDILKSRRAYSKLKKLESKPYFGVLIADYLGRDPLFRSKESALLNSVDCFFVTCKDLAEAYASEEYKATFSGVIYDFPNIEKIEYFSENREFTEGISKVIWVGNSKWGELQGYSDHKGLESVVIPLFSLLKQKYPRIELKIFDSALKRYANSDILGELGPTTILIQSSRSEGTGLPLLEALAMGATPITTRVGIAIETLCGKYESLIVRPNVTDFFAKCEEVIYSRPFSPQELQALFKGHFDSNLQFRFPLAISELGPSKLSKIRGFSIFAHFIWYSRYLLNTLKNK